MTVKTLRKWPENGPKIAQKGPKKASNGVKKRHQNDAKIITEWPEMTPDRPKMVQKLPQQNPILVLFWSQKALYSPR